MENNNSIETVYTYMDTIASLVEEHTDASYLEGLNEALNFLLDHAMEVPVDLDVEKRIKAAKETISNVSFSKEDVRKAIQLALLKGFKTLGVTNAMMTPDSIGMFLAYILEKLHAGKKPMKVLDPLGGTGNLLATLYTHYSEGLTFTGIEADPLLSKLADNILDALDIEHTIKTQDTLAFQSDPYDLVVTDFPIESVDRKNTYFPYQVILHHIEHVKPGGFFIALIENNFFEQNEADGFKSKLLQEAHLYGLIKLDEGLFTNHPKSMLILQKKMDNKDTMEQFLLVDLPPFDDEDAMGRSIQKIEQWFTNRKVD